MVIKVKGREGRLNEKKCIEGRKGGEDKFRTRRKNIIMHKYCVQGRIQEFVQWGLKFFSLSRGSENP